MARRREQVVGDDPRLEHARELGVGVAELLERRDEDRIGLLAPEEEELAAEQQCGLRAFRRVNGQVVRLAQVLDRRVAADQRLGRAELAQHVGAVRRGRRLGQCPPQVRHGALGRAARGGPPGGVAQRRDHLRVPPGALRRRCAATRSGSAPASRRRLAARACAVFRSSGSSAS